ncbi:MAG: colanic acid biosynthesis glycosyltransferase WcaL, partial [Planctomycetota bacterium]
MRVLFFLRGFPRASETFVLDQITGLIDRGVDVGVVSLRPGETEGVTHGEVEAYGLIERTLYLGSGEGRLGGRSIGWSPGNVAWGLWAGRAWRYGNKAVNGALQ